MPALLLSKTIKKGHKVLSEMLLSKLDVGTGPEMKHFSCSRLIISHSVACKHTSRWIIALLESIASKTKSSRASAWGDVTSPEHPPLCRPHLSLCVFPLFFISSSHPPPLSLSFTLWFDSFGYNRKWQAGQRRRLETEKQQRWNR